MAQKSNIRSMRFSNEIIQMIESQAGETFTAKFEALVQRCMWELPSKEKELERVKKEIEQERKKYDLIKKRAYEISNQISNCKYILERMEYQIKTAVENLKDTVKNS